MRCRNCGSENPDSKRFCGDCGAALSEAATAKAADVTVVATPSDGERRYLTVLFCDLVNSTSIATRLDPEEWRAIIADYHRVAAQAIERFGGHVAQYLGDGVMAYFGWPDAHENNAERAARAGLSILDAISKLNQHPTRPRLSARVGIDSGAVVVGASAGKNADVFGETPNIAAHVQAAALPGTVLITADTHRLLSGLFVVEDRGPQVLKGVERALQLYQVIQPSGVRGRLEAVAASRGLTPFVGRADELRLLMNVWEHALEGQSQAVLISGEAGIGKSRLLQHFQQQIAGRLYNWVEAAAAPFFQNAPFYPVAEMLRQLRAHYPDLGRVAGAPHRSQAPTRLARSNGHSGNGAFEEKEELLSRLESPQELALTPELAAALISMRMPGPGPDPSSPLAFEKLQLRLRLLLTLVEWVLGAAHVVPLVIAIEDLHWADASTLELIQLLAERGARAPLLLVCTARPGFRVGWQPRTHTQITVGPLGAYETQMMVERVALQKALSEDTVATVVARAGGVPLFVEELTRAVLDSGNLKAAAQDIPATLHDSLMARLDRLGPAKEVIQVGAVIGNEFSYELIAAIYPPGEKNLQSALHSLVDAQLLYVSATDSGVSYRFKHALIRDAAYEALLKSRRKDLHRRVARVIDERFPAFKEAHPEVLARHWQEAGETNNAVAEWSRAGKAAEARGAFKEALGNYQQAISLVNELSPSGERDVRELELRQSIIHMLWMTKGYSAPEAIDAVNHAVALAEKNGNANWLGSVWVSTFAAGDLRSASALADHALELASRKRDPVSLAGAHGLQLITRYARGDLTGCETHFAAGLKFFEARFLPAPAAVVLNLGIASCNAWLLGRADIARERERLTLAAAKGNDPYEVVNSKFQAASLRVLMRDYERAEALAAGALQLSEKHQFPYTAAVSRCVLGHARAQSGRASEGIALIGQGIAGLLEAGARLNIAYFTACLAAAQERKGAIVDALETIENALQANPDELVCRPETFRIRGELRLKHRQLELGEADFGESIALARSISAKAWELRATISLARLLDQQQRRDEARAILAEIYSSFTEGFDTADLKDAKALLDQLEKSS